VTLRQLVRQFPAAGRLEAIVLRPARGESAVAVNEAVAELGRGLIGDRRSARTRRGDDAQLREITLIQAEHLPVVAGLLGQEAIDPRRLRRNLVVSGVNLLAMHSPFPGERLVWAIGDSVRLVVTGPCDPCSKMEAEFGRGAYNALRGHGGMTACLVAGGTLRVGDRIALACFEPAPAA
jgi:MOSC domain-containing protein YiiM